MKRPFIHSALSIFMLCILTLTSAGYTAVVGFCSMTQSSTCCCCEEPAPKNDAPPHGMSITDLSSSCYTRSVAGGLNGFTAIVHSNMFAHFVATNGIPTAPQTITVAAHTLSKFLVDVDDAAPPCVDIYIRVSSFLI